MVDNDEDTEIVDARVYQAEVQRELEKEDEDGDSSSDDDEAPRLSSRPAGKKVAA
jgi:hypothetical protein